jgi:hypothetical protein
LFSLIADEPFHAFDAAFFRCRLLSPPISSSFFRRYFSFSLFTFAATLILSFFTLRSRQPPLFFTLTPLLFSMPLTFSSSLSLSLADAGFSLFSPIFSIFRCHAADY